MRSAKETKEFPYKMSTLCYFEVYNNGKVSHISHKNKSDINNINEAYKRALNKETTLYAVWPGNWRSDLFVIDDLEIFAKEFELLENKIN